MRCNAMPRTSCKTAVETNPTAQQSLHQRRSEVERRHNEYKERAGTAMTQPSRTERVLAH